MKKFVYLAAAAAVALTSTAASANPYNVSVGRQVFLDGGLAGSSLLRNETAQVSVAATHSALCTLAYTGASAPAGVATSEMVSAGATASGMVVLTADRVNPKGMAIGEAVYTGTFTATAPAANLSCPSGGTYELVTQEAQAGALISDAVMAEEPEPVCKEAAQADPKDDLVVGKCPKIWVEVSPAVYGPDIPEIRQTFSYSYALGTVSTTYASCGTGSLDGVGFTF